MANKKNRPNRRKSTTSNKPLVALLVVLVLLGGSMFLLEWIKGKAVQIEPKIPSVQEERHKIPARQSYNRIEMQPYTTALPDHKRHVRKKKATAPGTVAIIIDDMGASLQEANSLMAIDVPLTFSLIPGLPKVREIDKMAHDRGYQVMIHIPMEPKGYPQQRLEENGLLLSQSDEEVEKRVSAYFGLLPHAVGANNHMGSRFSENEHKMRVVLNQLKAHGLFYVDSRTTPQSVGLALARSMEVDSAGRNVFLDNDKDLHAITVQLEQLAAMARKKGSAIGICHPHKTTIQALAMNLPKLKREGITFVQVGDLVR